MNFNGIVSSLYSSSATHTKYKLCTFAKATNLIKILQLNRTWFNTYIQQEDKCNWLCRRSWAQSFFLHICIWGNNACSSTHRVLLIEGRNEKAYNSFSALGKKSTLWPTNLPISNISICSGAVSDCFKQPATPHKLCGANTTALSSISLLPFHTDLMLGYHPKQLCLKYLHLLEHLLYQQ